MKYFRVAKKKPNVKIELGFNIETQKGGQMRYNMDRLKSRVIEKFGEQKSFAEAIGTSESTVSRLLNGEADWRGSTMMKAVELLDIPHEEIEVYFFDKAVSKRKPQKV